MHDGVSAHAPLEFLAKTAPKTKMMAFRIPQRLPPNVTALRTVCTQGY